MPRGGKRQGAGRKSAWNSGKTKAVKLPEKIVPEIIEIARMMDCGDYNPKQIKSIFESSTKKLRAELTLDGSEKDKTGS